MEAKFSVDPPETDLNARSQAQPPFSSRASIHQGPAHRPHSLISPRGPEASKPHLTGRAHKGGSLYEFTREFGGSSSVRASLGPCRTSRRGSEDPDLACHTIPTRSESQVHNSKRRLRDTNQDHPHLPSHHDHHELVAAKILSARKSQSPLLPLHETGSSSPPPRSRKQFSLRSQLPQGRSATCGPQQRLGRRSHDPFRSPRDPGSPTLPGYGHAREAHAHVEGGKGFGSHATVGSGHSPLLRAGHHPARPAVSPNIFGAEVVDDTPPQPSSLETCWKAPSGRPRSRRLRALRAKGRRALDTLLQHNSSIHSFDETQPIGYLGPRLGKIARPMCTSDSLPLDEISVPALDLTELERMNPSLAPLLAPIRSATAFKRLLIPSASLPRSAPISLPHQPGWELPLLKEGIIKPCTRSQIRSLLSCFAVPKANGKVSRLVINAAALNTCCTPPPHFSLPSIFTLRAKMFRFNWAMVFDLRHCFTQFPVADSVSRYFSFRTKKALYRFARMAMGWSWSACIAQASANTYIDPVKDAAEAVYDDFVVMGDSDQQARDNATLVRSRMVRVGATEHPDKSMSDPAQVIVYMGAQWDLLHKRHRLAPAFVEKWSKWLDIFCEGHYLPLRSYWVALGALLYVQRTLMVPGCLVWPVFEWASQAAKLMSINHLTWSSMVKPWERTLVSMRKLSSIARDNHWVESAVVPRSPFILYSDSSLRAWSWLLSDSESTTYYGQCALHSITAHINILELLAAYYAIAWATRCFPRCEWNLRCDNMVTVCQLQRLRGGCFLSNTIIRSVVSMLKSSGCILNVRWVGTKDQLADAYILPGSTYDFSRLSLLPKLMSG